MALRISNVMASAMTDRVAALLSGTNGVAGSTGMLRIYGGTQPGTGGFTSGTDYCCCTISGLYWNAASAGTALLGATKTGTSGTAQTVSWGRLSNADGTSYIIDGSVGTAATSDFVVGSTVITAAEEVQLTTVTLAQPTS